MITTRFPQSAKYLQLEGREDVESVCVARIHRQSRWTGLQLWVLMNMDRIGRERLEADPEVLSLMVQSDDSGDS